MQATGTHSQWITADGRRGTHGDASLLFPYWSFTKTVIAICALKLYERGEIDLDQVLDGERFTLRQLLNHTSGLPDYSALSDYHAAVAADEDPWPRDRLLTAALVKGYLFEPGQGWSYSNVGFMLAREQLEVASGEDFAALVTDTICRPLGLNSIELATTREQFRRVHWPAGAKYHPGWVYHGCLIGTAEDAAHLLHALLCGALLGTTAVNEMLRRIPLGGAIEGRPWTDCGYGLGLMIGRMESAGRVIGHSGGGPFSVNAVYHFPERPDPVTVAVFSEGQSEGLAEYEAAAIAVGR
ncbi:serine hydrolase [Pleomorphomonas diazotrophica]|uniref:Serine hydrolase n=1 Tax=Pleomorphomonas diazotrophica TaxID=1166257 RepID=A0A1I4QPX9_9HYPH|nr:serine hydrolase domain-containing protein [Pleomorphomonas diazotrophica]PKR90502.1 serine hydrolase [Pleomorphomonas diazotrophica]SFM42142.1 CubicO group peptidase, beta-lactamase class C family [Pleomorphomonas diazotrophica]